MSNSPLELHCPIREFQSFGRVKHLLDEMTECARVGDVLAIIGSCAEIKVSDEGFLDTTVI